MREFTPPDDPRAALVARGIPVDEERLIRAIRSGDREAAGLLLAAGVRGNTRSEDGEAAIVIAARNGLDDLVTDLLHAGADPRDLSRAVSKGNRRKDIWEKLGALSGILTFTSSLLIAALGWYFTKSYNDRQTEAQTSQNRQQNRLVEMQTIERMIPHLIKDEQSKRAALIAINELASPTLAIQLGAAFGGTGAVEALGSIASQGGKAASDAVSGLAGISSRGTPEERAAVERALGHVFASARDSVVSVVLAGQEVCTGFVVDAQRALVLTAEYCVPERKKDLRVGSGQRQFTASIVSQNASAGIVLLRAPGLSAPALALADGSLQPGTRVTAIGAIGQPQAFPGVTTATDVDMRSISGGLGNDVSARGLVEVRFDTAGERRGSGGGPILDTNGSVVCMVYLGANDKDYCVPTSRLRASAASASN
jgi:hypothetical protein